MADPDEALIEAIAEAMCATTQIGDLTIEMSDLSAEDQEGTRDLARAAYAAMVAHLGLVEQFGTDEHCDDHEWADEFVDEASARRAADADPYLTVVRRLASRWTEVDHGSE